MISSQYILYTICHIREHSLSVCKIVENFHTCSKFWVNAPLMKNSGIVPGIHLFRAAYCLCASYHVHRDSTRFKLDLAKGIFNVDPRNYPSTLCITKLVWINALGNVLLLLNSFEVNDVTSNAAPTFAAKRP